MRQNGRRERLDLGVEGRLPPERLPRHRGGFDARTDRSEAHGDESSKPPARFLTYPSAFFILCAVMRELGAPTVQQALAGLWTAGADARLKLRDALTALSDAALRQPVPQVVETEMILAFEAEAALSRLLERLEERG